MSKNNILNIEKLLKPIKGKSPTGVNCRQDKSTRSLYYQIKDARNAARSAERRLQECDEQQSIQQYWKEVVSLGIEITTQHSKDLEIVAWLTEGLLRLHSFSGLYASFLLTTGLIQQYWDELYPEVDEDGIQTRVAPLAGLNGIDNEGSLILAISTVCVTEGSTVGPYALWHYQQALDLEKTTDVEKRQRMLSEGKPTLENIKVAVEETESDFYLRLQQDVQESMTAYQELTHCLEEKCGPEAPPSSYIKNALQTFQEKLEYMLKQLKSGLAEELITEEKKPTPNQCENDPLTHKTYHDTTTKCNNNINRESALFLIQEAAEYFAKAEPHSPISYLLNRSIRWAKLPLPELLKEMIRDEGACNSVYSLTGIEHE